MDAIALAFKLFPSHLSNLCFKKGTSCRPYVEVLSKLTDQIRSDIIENI